MAAPRKKTSPLTSSRSIAAAACVAAAVIVYLFVFGPLSTRSLPAATRTPGTGSPLASAPHLVCGDAGTHTEAASQTSASLDELALVGREEAGDLGGEVSLYQVSVDVPDEAAAKAALISWSRPENPDPLIQLSVTRAADGVTWQLAGITTCA